MNSLSRQTLMVDADDTLWENNILFEQAIAGFIEFLDHRTHTPQQVRDHLNRIEHERVKVHGYGLKSFRQALAVCFEELAGTAVTYEHYAAIERFTAIIAREEMDLLREVQSTLEALHTRHRILLVTKGDDEEQRDKLRRSGLAEYFDGVEVLKEKHPDAYEELKHRHACDAPCTWMIGNSPRSDINPALAVGLNAVYIPHYSTWVLEEEEIVAAPEGQRLLKLEHFGELCIHF